MPQETALDKIPPQSLEAEMAVLGSMLLEEDAISIACETLSADYFYKDAHRKIFEAISNLYTLNKAVDLITLADELKRTGMLE
jgi:replicative DNA helicase